MHLNYIETIYEAIRIVTESILVGMNENIGPILLYSLPYIDYKYITVIFVRNNGNNRLERDDNVKKI